MAARGYNGGGKGVSAPRSHDNDSSSRKRGGALRLAGQQALGGGAIVYPPQARGDVNAPAALLRKVQSEPKLVSKQGPDAGRREQQQQQQQQQFELLSRPSTNLKFERRKVVEVLANPEAAKIAERFFSSYAKKNASARLSYDDLKKVLGDVEKQLGIAFPTKAEKLFKRHDFDGNGALDMKEFSELFISSLRRLVFSPSSFVGREIFVTKQPGKVWDVYDASTAKKIGSGSFGRAYLAKTKKSGEERVVKAVKKTRAQLPCEDIEREVMVMLQVDHPHVVRLFQWFEDSHYIYLVMEALKGGTLAEILASFQKVGKCLKEEWSRDVIGQSVDAMAYVHSLRLIHKDLKDENIMLLKKDPNYDKPFAVIIDLGIAEMFSVSDPTGKIVGGTPVTMAPEVWKGEFGPKCDVWSMGCILFELLAGRFPFQARTINPNDWIPLHKRGPDWAVVRTSKESIALCQLMLTYRDVDRPSMAHVGKHPWFEVTRQNLKKLSPEQYQPLQAFCQQSALKRAVLLDFASKLPMDKAGRIVDAFKQFDVNNDSSLSYDEMKAAFKSVGMNDEALVKRTFNAMDVDGDQCVSFSEFVAGVLMVFNDIIDDQFNAKFRECDRDGDGYLDMEEARTFLGNAMELAQRDNSRKRPQEMLDDLFRGGLKKVPYTLLRERILGQN